MPKSFDINSDEIVVMANNLQKMHRSAFPLAVRGTLNSAAVHTKKNEIVPSAKRNFIARKPSFFKAFSKFDYAKGFDISKMEARAGMITKGQQAAKNLSIQETGGLIDRREFVPVDRARVSDSHAKSVQAKNRLRRIGEPDARIKTKNKNKLIRTAFAIGVGKHILYDDVLLRVKKVKRGKIDFDLLYDYEPNRKIKVEETNFVEEAAQKSTKYYPKFFNQNAKRQIERLKAKK